MQLEDILCSVPILIYPDPTLPYTVITDASGVAVHGAIMQYQGDDH